MNIQFGNIVEIISNSSNQEIKCYVHSDGQKYIVAESEKISPLTTGSTWLICKNNDINAPGSGDIKGGEKFYLYNILFWSMDL